MITSGTEISLVIVLALAGLALLVCGGVRVCHASPPDWKALREEMGDEAFYAFLRLYFDTYRYKVASGPDLLRLAEQVWGWDLSDLYTEWLGDTRDAIALEKGGIMRPGRPAVFGDLDAPAALIREARTRQVPLSVAGLDFSYEETARGWNWQGGGVRHDALPYPRLSGSFQLKNASAVMMLLTLIVERLPLARSAS